LLAGVRLLAGGGIGGRGVIWRVLVSGMVSFGAPGLAGARRVAPVRFRVSTVNWIP